MFAIAPSLSALRWDFDVNDAVTKPKARVDALDAENARLKRQIADPCPTPAVLRLRKEHAHAGFRIPPTAACGLLERRGIRQIHFVGDSIAFFAALGAIEYLSGDNTSYCDPYHEPACAGERKYFDEIECRRHFGQCSRAGLSIDPNRDDLQKQMCNGQVLINNFAAWNDPMLFSNVLSNVRSATSCADCPGPESTLLVGTSMRALTGRWGRGWADQDQPPIRSFWAEARKLGVRLIWMGIGHRNETLVPHNFFKVQSNVAVQRANALLGRIASEHCGQLIDPYLPMSSPPLASDTLDGTHYGWQTNAFKMSALLCALARSGNASEVHQRKYFSACKQLLISDEGQGVDRGRMPRADSNSGRQTNL